MQTKFKSGLNLFYTLFLVAFHIVILLLLTSPIFADTYVGLRFGIFLLVVDAAFFLPMIIFTRYEVREDYFYIRDWPFRTFKIPYTDILSVEDGDFEAKNKKIVAFSMNRIAVGYQKTVEDKKTHTTEITEEYIYISPAEISAFLLCLSGKMHISDEQAKERDALLEKKQAEHNKKKKAWQKQKAKLQAENQPEIIEINDNVKFTDFSTVEEEKDASDDSDK